MTITAKVICDSISPENIRLTTLQLRYPKFIHGEFLTHRMFSRNSSSSRAIPVKRLIQDVMNDPVIPIHWGANQKGMQADQECTANIDTVEGFVPAKDAWLMLRDEAVDMAREFDRSGYHKQIVNRIIEPWCHINTVVTATEWSNFFALRRHKDAQPEMRELANSIFRAMADSNTILLMPGRWHLPYINDDEKIDNTGDYDWDMAIKLSVARCARVSYLTQEGNKPSIDEDLRLYDRLVGSIPLHASPCEHQATPDTWTKSPRGDMAYFEHQELHGNFRGWIQYRKTLEGECQ